MRLKYAYKLALYVLLAGGITACSPPRERGYYYDEPVTVLLEELRAPITVEEGRAIKQNGKIVVYDNYLLINEPLEGVHIYNNENPDNPLPIGFLPIMGNTDIVVKNDVMYANNYIDLVLFDLSNIDDIKVLHRSEAVFSAPYDVTRFRLDVDSVIVIDVVRKWREYDV